MTKLYANTLWVHCYGLVVILWLFVVQETVLYK